MTAHPITVPDVLAAAADWIEQHGWFQGEYCDSDDESCCCVAGAFNVIAGGKPAEVAIDGHVVDAKVALIKALNPSDDFDADNLTDDEVYDLEAALGYWNDEAERTADEVIATLRRVAAKQRTAATR